MIRKRFLFVLLLTLLLALGCGGGGGGTDTTGDTGGAARGTGELFITDGMDHRGQVWITIKKVVLLSATGNVTAFEDAEGVTVDLKTLRDENGERYAFLSTIPAGTYTGVEVTVDKTVTIYPRGSTTGETREFAGNDGTNAVLSLTFQAPRTINDGSKIVLDFSLSDWSDDGTTVTGAPFLRLSRGDGIHDHNRHEHNGFKGTLSALAGSAPSQTFTLSRGPRSLKVVTDETTTIFFASGAESAALANGQHVAVHGSFSPTLKAFVADSIRVQDIQEPKGVEVRGKASNANAEAGTFTLSVRGARGAQLRRSDITVATTESTVLISKDGVTLRPAQFFAELATDGFAEAEGAFNKETQTLTARRVRIHGDRHGSGHGHGHKR